MVIRRPREMRSVKRWTITHFEKSKKLEDSSKQDVALQITQMEATSRPFPAMGWLKTEIKNKYIFLDLDSNNGS